MNESDDGGGCGCLLIFILFLIVISLCDRIDQLENKISPESTIIEHIP